METLSRRVAEKAGFRREGSCAMEGVEALRIGLQASYHTVKNPVVLILQNNRLSIGIFFEKPGLYFT
jgi:hypothetical protein